MKKFSKHLKKRETKINYEKKKEWYHYNKENSIKKIKRIASKMFVIYVKKNLVPMSLYIKC